MNRTDYYDLVERRRTAQERRYVATMRRALNLQFRTVEQRLRAGIIPDAADVSEVPIRQGMESLYVGVGEAFATNTFDGLMSGDYTLKAAPSLRTAWREQMVAYVTQQVAGRISGITETTRAWVRSAVGEALAEGYSIPDAAKLIRSGWKRLTRKRAVLIARTEIISASNHGSLIGAVSTGLQLEKEWLATRDARTRDQHIAANGQRTDLQGVFIVGGESMRYPGDPRGSASNTVQCRCAIGYVPVG